MISLTGKLIMSSVIKIAIFSAYFFLTLSSATSESMKPEIAPKYPNIVLFLADDMSWFDVGAYHQPVSYTHLTLPTTD